MNNNIHNSYLSHLHIMELTKGSSQNPHYSKEIRSVQLRCHHKSYYIYSHHSLKSYFTSLILCFLFASHRREVV